MILWCMYWMMRVQNILLQEFLDLIFVNDNEMYAYSFGSICHIIGFLYAE